MLEQKLTSKTEKTEHLWKVVRQKRFQDRPHLLDEGTTLLGRECTIIGQTSISAIRNSWMPLYYLSPSEGEENRKKIFIRRLLKMKLIYPKPLLPPPPLYARILYTCHPKHYIWTKHYKVKLSVLLLTRCFSFNYLTFVISS